MEYHNTERHSRHRNARILGGILIITYGILFLMNRVSGNIPHWILSWEMILIAIGVVSLIKHNFRHFISYVILAVGTVFLINEFYPGTIDSGLILPVFIITLGLVMLAKTTGIFKSRRRDEGPFNSLLSEGNSSSSPNDFLESSTFFGGATKNITSKNFQGADVTSIFGGTELNFTKADMQHPVTINTTTLFGGLELIVPSDWHVQSELTTIFGGLEDNRGIMSDTSVDERKILILKGTCVFGGVEIKSYS
jgi:predicted membrane protein